MQAHILVCSLAFCKPEAPVPLAPDGAPRTSCSSRKAAEAEHGRDQEASWCASSIARRASPSPVRVRAVHPEAVAAAVRYPDDSLWMFGEASADARTVAAGIARLPVSDVDRRPLVEHDDRLELAERRGPRG